MSNTRITTLTLNPALDVSCEADEVRHTQKTRTENEQVEAGGGGINVARVLKRFGADVEALFIAGGGGGAMVEELLARRDIPHRRIDAACDMRTNLTVHERSTNREYRFVSRGPILAEKEWRAALDAVGTCDCDWFIASGSLPRGVPDDFYARVGDRLAPGTRLVVDTSKAALASSVERGGMFILKPNIDELEELVGRKLDSPDDVIAEAKRMVDAGTSEWVAVTLEQDGAVLVGPDVALKLPALPVEPCSTVGAGDSFVAALVLAFSRSDPPEQALRFALAAGAAAVITCGSDLARKEDVERLLNLVPQA